MVENKPKSPSDYWDNVAGNYDIFYRHMTPLVNAALLPLLSLESSSVVLETGCGSGLGIQLLLKNYPNLPKILASDISPMMIQVAQSKNLPNTEFVVSQNESLPFESNSCDRYISNLAFQFSANPELVLQEAFRVLNSTGILAFSVWAVPTDQNVFKILANACKNSGLEPNKDRDPANAKSQEFYVNLARNAGFSDVRSYSGSVPFNVNSADEFLGATATLPDIQNLKLSNPDAYNRYMNELRAEYERVVGSGCFITFQYLAVKASKLAR